MRTVAISSLLIGLAFASAASGSDIPAGYPANYAELVEASKSDGEILVYNDMNTNYWAALLPALNAKYPWLKVSQVDLGDELFERFYAENATNSKTADLILTSEPDYFNEFAAKDFVEPYLSPEAGKFPNWSKPVEGLYSVAVSPLIMIYNKHIIAEDKAPKSLTELAAYANANPGTGSPIASYSLSWAAVPQFYYQWLKRNPESGEKTLASLPGVLQQESGASSMIEKVTTGEVKAAYFVSTTTAFNRLQQPTYAAVLGWSLIEDGTPMVPKGMAIPKGAKNAAASKLLLDFLLSHDAQVILAKQGLTPLSADVKKEEVPYFTYNSLVEALGEEKAMVIGYDSKEFSAERQAFLTKLKSLTKLQ